jgi:transposase
MALKLVTARRTYIPARRAWAAATAALIERLQRMITTMKHERCGACTERDRRLLDQMALQLRELSAVSGENDLKAVDLQVRDLCGETAPRPLLRRRIVHPAPTDVCARK